MPRITTLDPSTPSPAQPMLEHVQQKLGMVPNLLRTMAHAPATLQSYLQQSAALAGGNLSAGERELLALRIAEFNDCDYCLAAHTAIGGSVGLSSEAMLDARNGSAVLGREDALLTFTDAVLSQRGHVSDADLASARANGLSDADLLEVVAHVAFNTDQLRQPRCRHGD